ncbi:hypothetical protein PHLCEN_2v12490 [Hermanssonia centrifuga]|uniref:Thioester reductase (TE) domain-containing protein n=1 Tax=Hermanssonia centrifuga TaxID=98765 RepID=A0A2R6NGX2_9APHY|nr:hypothetical protein PHLCEN_2v12490 [Hermanssonia centrifuga]
MFGRGRFNAGVLIDPRPASAFDPADQEKLVDFRNKIWPTVEKMNEFAPQHSRLFKEMIIVASPKKPFSYTAKNTARRLALINEYDAEIDALYAAVDESTQADLSPPSTWDLPSATTFVREVVNRVLKDSVGDNDDLFQKGCDSLQATWIRNSLLHALRDTTKLNTRTVTSSFVYQYSSINALASFLSRLASAGHEVISDKERVEAMLNMVEKYSTEFPTHTSSVSAPAQDVILLTGTTGGIGATLLGLLAASPEVSRVYALNRRNQQPLNKRQHAVFKDRGIDVTLLDSHKVVLIETDLGGDKLGLPLELWEEIRTSVTHIIHNAWPVNFNLSLKSFEPAVKTVRDLIDLSLASPLPKPPQFVFISSVGVLRHLEPGVPVKEGPVDASVATGLGYSESKWVAEKLLSTASNITPLQSVSIRVGQVTGGASGAWNSTEWFPSLVRTSVSLGCLPTLHKEVSWISAVATAETILEMRNSSVANLHLAHPRPVSWSTIMEPIAQHLALDLVPYDEWFAQLEKKSSGLGADAEVEMLRQFPAAKILDFFSHEKSNSISVEAMGIPRLDVSEAERISTTLQKLPPLTGDDALRWVAYWKQAGLL